MEPVNYSKLMMQAPVAEFNNKNSQKSMNDEMDNREYKIDSCVAQFCFFILQNRVLAEQHNFDLKNFFRVLYLPKNYRKT